MMQMVNTAMLKTIQKPMRTLSMVISKTSCVKWKKNQNDLAIIGKKWVFVGIRVFTTAEGKQQQKNNIHYVEAVDTDFLEIKNDMFWWVLVLQDVGECKNAQMLKKCEKMKTTCFANGCITNLLIAKNLNVLQNWYQT